MRHDFLDKYSQLDSPVHRLDPRGKILVAFLGIGIIVTEPLYGRLYHFAFYFALIFLVTVLARLPVVHILKRLLVVSPFILMAALFYPLSIFITGRETFGENREMVMKASAIIFSKAFLAVWLLVLLTSTNRFHGLLLALRKLKMPRLIGTISALLYRYGFLLVDEALRTTRARESRTPGRLRMKRTRVYGNQMAVVFLRSWERSQIIYKSMLSRGFSGEFPDAQQLHLTAGDVISSMVFVSLLLAVRLWA